MGVGYQLREVAVSDKARLREELDDVRVADDAHSMSHQRLLKSLNNWADELEATGHIGRFIAAELRRRMETP